MKTHDKNNPTTGAMGLLALLALTCLLIVGGTAPASANTYQVTSSLCNGGGGTLEWAVQQANANPGPDIINIYFGLEIDGDSCSVGFWSNVEPADYYMITVTDSLTIEGNGARVIGHMSWIDSNGNLNNHSSCPWSMPKVVVTNIPPGFIKVGTKSNPTANAGLTVTVKNFNISQLNSIARVNEGASLTLDTVNTHDIWSFYRGCGETPPLIGQKNVNVTLKNSRWDRILTWSAYLVPELPGETIAAESGNLTIENSKLFSMDAAAVSWDGTATNKVNIVTTEIFNSGGIAVRGDVNTNFVNSLFYADPLSNVRIDQRFVNASTGPMNLVASTFLFTSLECGQQCQDLGSPGYFYSTQYGGAINFQQSGVGVGWPGAASGVYLLNALTANPNIFSADQYTFMQPDGSSNTAAKLQAITNQPLLLTTGPAFATDPPPLFSAGAWATPLSPGVLIGAVPNAGTGGANELKSPIDNQPILLDVFGTLRVNATNNTRNIGALQYSGTPVLSLNSVGDGLANLSWTRPPDPPAGAITGYYLYYRVKGNPGQWGVHDIPGPATLHDQITGLTNGQAYEFYVAVVVNSVEQQSSNIVTGTPYGPVGVPVVSGTQGANQVQLFWTEPTTLGGHSGPVSYFVTYRVKGQTQWIAGPGNLSGRITTIPGLTGGTEYEFGVAAQTFDGAIAPVVGTTTATPLISQTITFGAAPVVSVGGTGSVSATGGGSGNPVTLASVTPGVCALNGNIVTGLAVGACTITADQVGNANYGAAPQATQNFNVGLSQTVSFGVAPQVSVGGTGIVSATGGASGNPVTFASATPGVCTVSGNTVTGVAHGTCTIVATQLGNGSYNAASQATQSFNISQGNPANTEIECLLNWAEHTYPGLFSPAGALTQTFGPYTYRYYAGTHAYLGVSTNNRVYYMDEFGNLHDEGPLGNWLPRAGCQPVPPPSDCLFNWAQKYYPDLFGPAGFVTQVSGEYYYRYYAATDTYLGISSIDGNVYYMGSNRQLQGQGPLSLWLTLVGCQ